MILGILLVLMAMGQKNWRTLCFVLLFFVPLVALATPLYILLVLIIGLSRVVSPDFSWTFFGFDLKTSQFNAQNVGGYRRVLPTACLR